MADSDNTRAAEILGDFFKSLGKERHIAAEKKAEKVLKNQERALENGSNVGSAFASRRPKATFSTLENAINFYHTVKRLIVRNFDYVFV